MIWHPKYDGVDHYNVSIFSENSLGRVVSLEFKCIFKHPEYGEFHSLKSFYYWLYSGKKADKVRNLTGKDLEFAAKNLFKAVSINKKFKEEIVAANFYKIKSFKFIQKMLLESKQVPFVCYKYLGNKLNNTGIGFDKTKQNQYFLDSLEEIRFNIKKNGLL
jgi:hypothetical protein